MMFEFAFNNSRYSDRKLRLLLTDLSSDADFSRLPKQQDEEILHVSTIVLAKNSLFFRKMFDADFKESLEKALNIQLKLDEKDAFWDLIKYMYTGVLEANTVENLLRVWLLSDRFIVASCGELCTHKLLALPLSFNNSCFILEKAANMQKTLKLENLVNRALKVVINYFGEMAKMKADFQQLSPQVLEFLLASDDLCVPCEEEVYGALQSWIEANCHNRAAVDTAWSKFGPLIRWHLMDISFLKAHVRSTADNSKVLQTFIVEALLCLASSDGEETTSSSVRNRFHRRVNSLIPIKFTSIASPAHQAIMFFNISVDDWERIKNTGVSMHTQKFRLNGCWFHWEFVSTKLLSMCLRMWRDSRSVITFNISLSKWDAKSHAFVLRWKHSSSNVRVKEHVATYRFGDTLEKMFDDSRELCDNIIYFRAELEVSELV